MSARRRAPRRHASRQAGGRPCAIPRASSSRGARPGCPGGRDRAARLASAAPPARSPPGAVHRPPRPRQRRRVARSPPRARRAPRRPRRGPRWSASPARPGESSAAAACARASSARRALSASRRRAVSASAIARRLGSPERGQLVACGPLRGPQRAELAQGVGQRALGFAGRGVQLQVALRDRCGECPALQLEVRFRRRPLGRQPLAIAADAPPARSRRAPRAAGAHRLRRGPPRAPRVVALRRRARVELRGDRRDPSLRVLERRSARSTSARAASRRRLAATARAAASCQRAWAATSSAAASSSPAERRVACCSACAASRRAWGRSSATTSRPARGSPPPRRAAPRPRAAAARACGRRRPPRTAAAAPRVAARAPGRPCPGR